MPTNANGYNSRVTSESLEKRFRDTFTAQGGAELVDDLYASGVIVPVVDFTQAAEGSGLQTDLQQALDLAVTPTTTANTTNTIISNAGFWRVDIVVSTKQGSALDLEGSISISDGFTTKKLRKFNVFQGSSNDSDVIIPDFLVVFVKSGAEVSVTSDNNNMSVFTCARQIATVTGDLVNPSGFTSS